MQNVDRLACPNLDLRRACTTVINRLPRLLPLRPELIRMPSCHAESFDQLEDFARATRHSHLLVEVTGRPSASLLSLSRELRRYHTIFAADLTALIGRGQLDVAHVRALRGVRSHRDLTRHTLGLIALLRDYHASAPDRSHLSVEELDQAERIAEEQTPPVGAGLAPARPPRPHDPMRPRRAVPPRSRRAFSSELVMPSQSG
jgi:hypothetical protein